MLTADKLFCSPLLFLCLFPAFLFLRSFCWISTKTTFLANFFSALPLIPTTHTASRQSFNLKKLNFLGVVHCSAEFISFDTRDISTQSFEHCFHLVSSAIFRLLFVLSVFWYYTCSKFSQEATTRNSKSLLNELEWWEFGSVVFVCRIAEIDISSPSNQFCTFERTTAAHTTRKTNDDAMAIEAFR